MDKINKFDGTQYRFLSNFYTCVVHYDGIIYPSSEHAYQAAKTTDFTLRQVIANMDTPGQTKSAGKRLSIREGWNTIKFNIMSEIVLIKFATSASLRLKLLGTGDAELIEGNTWGDQYWGVCNGKGENNLGKILMHVRNILKA